MASSTMLEPVGRNVDGTRPAGLRERRASSGIAANSSRLTFTSISGLSSSNKAEGNSALGDDDHGHVIAKATPKDFSLQDVIIPPPSAALQSHHHFGAATGPSLPQTPVTTTPGNLSPTRTTSSNYFSPKPADQDLAIAAAPKAERYKFRLASGFFFFFCAGWSDGTPGTIIPYLEKYYGLSHFKVSFLFIAATVGFGVGTIAIEPLLILFGRFSLNATRREYIPYIFSKPSRSTSTPIGYSLSQGRLWTLLIASISHITYFVIAACRPPFWGLLIGFFFSGCAVSIMSGQLNAYVAASSVRTQGRALGNIHGFYGVGAFASPLVSQSLLAAGWKWNQFYYISIGISVLNLAGLIWTFHPTREEFQHDREEALGHTTMGDPVVQPTSDSIELEGVEQTGGSRSRVNGGPQPKSTMRMALSIPYVWVFMAFLMVYTGSETTTGGWIVSYLLKERNANPDTVGYVASGFWGGLAVGRIVLGHASPYLGIRKEKHLVHVYILLCVAMTFVIWFVPSFVGNAFCAALMGALLGPIFPTSLSLATKLLPKEVHLTALAAMSSFAAIGSALFPFVAGALASAKGIVTIQPFMLSILVTMGTLWCFFPSRVGMSA